MTRTIEQISTELEALRRTAGRYNAAMNEGGDGYNPHSEALRQLQAEYDRAREAEVEARVTALHAAEDAEWTREVTIQRRADWNAWVRSQGRAIHPTQVSAHCQEVGYDNLTLARQIKRHGL